MLENSSTEKVTTRCLYCITSLVLYKQKLSMKCQGAHSIQCDQILKVFATLEHRLKTMAVLKRFIKYLAKLWDDLGKLLNANGQIFHAVNGQKLRK